MLQKIKSEQIGREVFSERMRAHLKHGDKSTESQSWTSPVFLTVLVEEIGEVAKAINEYRVFTNQPHRLAHELRAELIQVAAMCEAWIVAIDDVFLEL